MNVEVCQVGPFREPAGGGVLVRAAAKLNLSLAVLARRADGFHELDSAVAKVSLYDELLIRPRDDGEIRFECDRGDLGPPEANLAFRAAKALAAEAGAGGADIRLVKRIPPAAGLGGGSSDAASTLLALNELWGLDLPAGRLAELAAGLGSDVPLFLGGPASRMRGRGERIEPLDVHTFFAIVCMPPLACPTAEVYAEYDRQTGVRQAGRAASGPAGIERFSRAPSQWGPALRNDLQPAAEAVCPALAEVEARLAEATGMPVHLTGSGSAMFVPFDEPADARAAAAPLPDDLARLCRIVRLNPW